MPRMTESLGLHVPQHMAYNLSVKQNRESEYFYAFTASCLSGLSGHLDQATSSDFGKRPIASKPVVLCFGGQNGKTVTLNEDLFRSCRVLQTHLVGPCLFATAPDVSNPQLLTSIAASL